MPSPNAGIAFAQVLVDELTRHGIHDAVLSPGSRSTPLALALAEDARIRLHVRIDERSASFTALGLARVTGRPVPVLCTSGTAAAEFHAAVLEADQGRVPLLVLTADRPPELRGIGANQTLDQIKLYGTAVRWFHELGVPEARADVVRYWRSTISQAVAFATGMTGPAGPVHLNVPLREPLVPADDGVDFPVALDGRDGGHPWTDHVLGERLMPPVVHDAIAAAASGVVVAGAGLRDADANAVVQFTAARGWPLLAEPHSNARRPPAAVGGCDAVLRSDAFRAAHTPDVVVVAGRVGLTRPMTEWLVSLPSSTQLILVDRYGSWWDATRTATTVVAADPAALARVEGARAPEAWSADWRNAAAAAQRAVNEILDASALTEPRLARDLAAALPDDALLAVASSMPIRDLDLTMRPRSGLRIVANRGVSGIDGFVSTAVGAALAHTAMAHTGPSWALAGDLSALHDVNGLLADPVPDLTIVVVNNDGGGIFSLLPQGDTTDVTSFERIFGTPHGVSLADVCRGYGVDHVAVADVASYDEILATAPKGLRLVEVRTDRRDNAELHRRLTAAAASAVSDWSARSADA